MTLCSSFSASFALCAIIGRFAATASATAAAADVPFAARRAAASSSSWARTFSESTMNSVREALHVADRTSAASLYVASSLSSTWATCNCFLTLLARTHSLVRQSKVVFFPLKGKMSSSASSMASSTLRRHAAESISGSSVSEWLALSSLRIGLRKSSSSPEDSCDLGLLTFLLLYKVS